MPQTSNTRQVVKNTLFLYFRMLVIIVVGLYSNRLILQTLGVSDYGIYTLVGSIVLMASFLNTGMMQASQRFLSFALGRGDENEIRETFSTSLLTHILIAAIVFVLSETIGLYIVQHLNIPADRMWAANRVYQCSIFTLIASVMSVPYNSMIIAYERMNFYAYISVLEVFLKLVILYLLVWSPLDKLVSYALLYLVVQILVRFVYSIYCRRHFFACGQKILVNKVRVGEMFRFAGWSLLGNFGISFREQGTNIILNIFFGTVVNAARGITASVSSVISHFATNFTLALNPPIVKNYAAGNYKESARLVYLGSRMSFFMLTFLTIPFLTHVDYILELWLGIVPDNTSLFLYFVLGVSLIYSMSQPVTVAIQATGKIKSFQIWICSLMLAELAATSFILCFTQNLVYALMPSIVSNLAALVVRFHLLKKMVSIYQWKDYILTVMLRCWLIYGMCFGIIWLIKSQLVIEDSILCLLLCVLSEIGLIAIIIFSLGMSASERRCVMNRIPILKELL